MKKKNILASQECYLRRKVLSQDLLNEEDIILFEQTSGALVLKTFNLRVFRIKYSKFSFVILSFTSII